MSFSTALLTSGCTRGRSALPQKASVFDVINSRTSIRQFDPNREVSNDHVETLLRSAMCSPTALNSQPWEFIVVRDATILTKLAEGLPYSRIGNGAKLAIIICGDTDIGLQPPRAKEYWIQDCSAASQNLLIATKGLGLGAVWTAIYPMEDRIGHARKVLGIPERFMPLNAIPIGWPTENPQPKNKWKPERIHRNQW